MLCFPLDNVEYEARALGAWLGTRTRGVFSAEGNLAVSPGGELSVLVSRGLAWLKADEFWGTVCLLDESQTLALESAHSALPRIDAVCVRLDKDAGTAGLVIKTGSYAQQPVMPQPVRDLNVDEIVLAAVTVPAGAARVEARYITDCRLNEALCGLMRDGVSGIPTEVLQAQLDGLMGLVESELGRLNAGTEVMLKTEYAAEATAAMTDGTLVITSVYGHPGTQYDVRFNVPSGYKPGVPVKIDGDTVTLRDSENLAAELEAAPGTPAWLTRRGPSAFFRQGGGVKLTVKHGATQPASPREGTLWVQTSAAIPKTMVAATQPAASGQAAGTVWIRTGSESRAAFKLDGKNPITLYPKAAAQLASGAWQARTLKVYTGGNWKGCGQVLAPNPVEWPVSKWTSNFGRSANAAGGIAGTLAPSNYGIGYVYAAVDVTDWGTLTMNCSYSNNLKLDYAFYLNLGYSTGTISFTDSYNTSSGLPAAQSVALKEIASGQLNGSFNVSALRGIIYVGLRYYGAAYGAARSVGYVLNSIELN